MRENAVVESVQGEYALVKVKRSTACGDSCATCSAQCKNQNSRIEVENKLGARVGESVVIEMKTSKVLKSAFIVYILPLIILFGTYFGADFLGYNETISVICSLVSFFITFIVLHFVDKRIKSSLAGAIVEINNRTL
ncbi:MAG: SoxR reducing system RseC family protein [Clostridia bacterium]|nr:SoxR reducing system RseC family protein [Clostridia bacterium]